MPNYDGQYEVRVIYDTTPTGFTLLEHTLTFDVLPTAEPAPGDEFADISVVRRKAVDITLETAMDSFVAGMIGLYPASTTIVRAELWYIPEGTFAGSFIATYPINEIGTAAGDEVVAQQMTYTFRSIAGGSGRLQFMETSVTGNAKTSYPYGSAAQNALPDLVTGTGGFIIARDNSFMFANIHQCLGQNERLWRKRYRS